MTTNFIFDSHIHGNVELKGNRYTDPTPGAGFGVQVRESTIDGNCEAKGNKPPFYVHLNTVGGNVEGDCRETGVPPILT